MDSWILTAVIFSPLVGAAWVYGGDPAKGRSLRNRALIASLVTALLTLVAVIGFFSTDGAAEQADSAWRPGRRGSAAPTAAWTSATTWASTASAFGCLC